MKKGEDDDDDDEDLLICTSKMMPFSFRCDESIVYQEHSLLVGRLESGGFGLKTASRADDLEKLPRATSPRQVCYRATAAAGPIEPCPSRSHPGSPHLA
jgi:hypothetical protein